jgi:hypothetical protein
MSTWIDRPRQKLFSVHSGSSLVVGDIVLDDSSMKVNSLNESALQDLQSSFLYHTRGLALNTFQKCMENEMGLDIIKMETLFDRDYDDVR